MWISTLHCVNWPDWDLDHISYRESFDYSEIYSYVEISQNNHQRGQNQWDNGMRQIEKLRKAGMLRPVTILRPMEMTWDRMEEGVQSQFVENLICNIPKK